MYLRKPAMEITHKRYLKLIYGVAGTWRDALWLNTSWGRPNNRAVVTNLMQLHTLRCWGLTENDEANIKHSVDI